MNSIIMINYLNILYATNCVEKKVNNNISIVKKSKKLRKKSKKLIKKNKMKIRKYK